VLNYALAPRTFMGQLLSLSWLVEQVEKTDGIKKKIIIEKNSRPMNSLDIMSMLT